MHFFSPSSSLINKIRFLRSFIYLFINIIISYREKEEERRRKNKTLIFHYWNEYINAKLKISTKDECVCVVNPFFRSLIRFLSLSLLINKTEIEIANYSICYIHLLWRSCVCVCVACNNFQLKYNNNNKKSNLFFRIISSLSLNHHKK